MKKKWKYIQPLIKIMEGQKKGFAGKQKTQAGFPIKNTDNTQGYQAHSGSICIYIIYPL